MRTRFDQMSKHMLGRMGALRGSMEQQREIVTEPQAADLWFQPTPARAPARRGLFDRMLEAPCMIEYFYDTPSLEDLLDCASKQLNLRRMLKREAARQTDALEPPPAVVPQLWILSAGRPARAMRALGLVPMDGWPPGLWQTTTPPLHMYLAVLRDLPVQRDTLLLRTLSRGMTFRGAMHELHALPADAWEVRLAIPLLLAFRGNIFQNLEGDEMQHYTDEVQAIYDEWEMRVKHAAWKQGEEAGRKQGEEAGRKAERRQSLHVIYQARFGALPPEVQAAIETMENIDTLQHWLVPFATAAPEQIAALVREG